MKKIIMILMLILLIVGNAYAEEEVVVKLPDFEININDAQVINKDAKYPFITFRNITYYPMTWDNALTLGLLVTWDAKNGLEVNKIDETKPYTYEVGEINPKNINYYAEIIEDTVTVNSKYIDNTKENYPLLKFRDVIYFPLTYNYMVEEFNATYEWNEFTGLSITSDRLNKVKPLYFKEHFTYEEINTQVGLKKGIFEVKMLNGKNTIGYSDGALDHITASNFDLTFKLLDEYGYEIGTEVSCFGSPFSSMLYLYHDPSRYFEYASVEALMITYPEQVMEEFVTAVEKEVEIEHTTSSIFNMEYIKEQGIKSFNTIMLSSSTQDNNRYLAYKAYYKRDRFMKDGIPYSLSYRTDDNGEKYYALRPYYENRFITGEYTDLTFENTVLHIPLESGGVAKYFAHGIKIYDDENQLKKILIFDDLVQ